MAAFLLLAAFALAGCAEGGALSENAIVISKPDETPRVLAVVVTTSEVIAGQNDTLTLHAEAVTLNGTTAEVVWLLEQPYEGCAIIKNTGELTLTNAPVGTFTIRAVSVADETKTGEARVTVVSGQPSMRSVEVTPGMARIPHGTGLSFSATVAGSTGNQAVTWEAAGGTDNGTGFAAGSNALTVGSNETSPILTVTARSTEDPRISGQALVLVPVVDEVVVTPSTAAVAKGGQLQFYAAVTGAYLEADNRAVQWGLTGNADDASTITAQGLLSVGTNETAEVLVVRVFSKYDERKSGAAGVAVSAVQAAVLNHVEATNTNGTTSKLTLFFDRDIPGGLAAGDIQITPVGAVTVGAVSRIASGVYEIPVTGVAQSRAVQVAAVKTGITFSPSSQSVAVRGVTDSGNASIKAKFGVTTAGATGVRDTFNELHAFIQAGGLTAPSVIRLGDWIDLEGGLTVAAYGGGGGDFSYSDSSDYTRLIVVGINSFHSGRGTFPNGDGITVNGTTQNGQTGGQYTVTANDATPHVVFQFRHIPVLRQLNSSGGNRGGYRDSEIRQYLLQNFLPGLKSAGVPEGVLWAPLRYVSAKGSGSEIEDALWLPTDREMFQNAKDNTQYNEEHLYAEEAYETAENQARLEYYTDNASRIKLQNTGEAYGYWEASPLGEAPYLYSGYSNTWYFCYVRSNGTHTYHNTYSVSGCAPAFCVK